jgi:hypothetical protein
MNSFIVRHADDKRAMESIIQSPDYFRQTCIAGTTEYAMHILMVDAEPAYVLTAKYDMSESV